MIILICYCLKAIETGRTLAGIYILKQDVSRYRFLNSVLEEIETGSNANCDVVALPPTSHNQDVSDEEYDDDVLDEEWQVGNQLRLQEKLRYTIMIIHRMAKIAKLQID